MTPGRAEPCSWRALLLGIVGAWVLRLWSLSWRKRLVGVECLDACIASGQRTMVLCWHGTYVPLFGLLRGRPVCVLTNNSLRGQVIAQISQRFGYATLQLPDQQERHFLTALRQNLDDYTAWGTAADGPLGPCHRIKPSLVSLTAHFGFSVQLVGVAARQAWRLNRRWDHMLLPLPFTRVGLVLSELIPLPHTLDKPMAARQAEILQNAMQQCTRDAEDLIR